MSTSLSALVPELRDGAIALVEEARAAGLAPQITSTRRTYAEQKALYEKFLRGESQYPASPPGTGSHETGEAFDMVVTPMEYLADLGDLWESWGGRWGGVWRNPDVIHFELRGASERARSHPTSGMRHALTSTIDFVLGLNPAMGLAELGGYLLSLGFPKSEIAKALESPVTYVFGG